MILVFGNAVTNEPVISTEFDYEEEEPRTHHVPLKKAQYTLSIRERRKEPMIRTDHTMSRQSAMRQHQ